jgi:hypothetical protein
VTALEDLLGPRGARCLVEGIEAFRRGLYLAAASLAGAASEAAWFSTAETLPGRSQALDKALVDDQIGPVIKLVAEQLRSVKAVRKSLVGVQRTGAACRRAPCDHGCHCG